MSEPQDMVESQVRNEFGMPFAGWVHRGNGGVYAPVNTSVNSALNWAAALFGGGAIVGVLVICLLRPWQSDDRAAQAELRAEFAQRFAAVEKDAGDAAAVSEIWRNRVNKLEAEANANRRR